MIQNDILKNPRVIIIQKLYSQHLNKQEIIINETMPQSDINYKCPFCRNVITSLKPTFFL